MAKRKTSKKSGTPPWMLDKEPESLLDIAIPGDTPIRPVEPRGPATKKPSIKVTSSPTYGSLKETIEI